VVSISGGLAQVLVQVFDHVEGQRAALVGLLVEEAQRGDLVLVLRDVVGKGLDHGLGLRSACSEAREGDLIEVDVVDDLLALAAGAFDLVAQLGLVEGRAGGGHALGAGGFDLLRAAGCLRCG
jgi:hypothetical protein